MIIIVNLQDTLNPISAQERVKINQNWSELRRSLSSLQSQINFLSGGNDIDEIINRIETSISQSESVTGQAQTALNNISNALQELETFMNEAGILNQQVTDAINSLNSTLNNMKYLGAYNASTTYQKGNYVRLNKDSYVALKQNVGLPPVDDGVNWTLIAVGGIDGAGSVSKVNGVSPNNDGNVQLDSFSEAQFNLIKEEVNKSKIVVNVKDFGALGNGTANDTASIQSAIDSITNGGILFFPSGTYNVNSLSIKNSVNVVGVKGTSILKHINNASSHMFKVDSNDLIIKFKDMEFDGNNLNQSNPANRAIIFSQRSSIDMKVEGCFFKDVSYGGIYFYGDNSTTTREVLEVFNCRFIGGLESTDDFPPRYIGILDGVEADIYNNYFDFGRDPVRSPMPAIWIGGTQIESVSQNRINIKDNTIIRCGRNTLVGGIGAIDCYIFGKLIQVTGNTFRNCYVTPIRFKANSEKIIISDNHIENVIDPNNLGNCGIQIAPLTAGTVMGEVIITNNTVSGVASSHGIQVDSAAGQVIRKVIIDSNIVRDVARNGIFVDFTTEFIVSNNVVSGTQLQGIIISSSSNGKIVGNMVSETTQQGISFSFLDGLLDISNNHLFDIVGNGIQNTGNSTTGTLTLNNNIFERTGANCIAVENLGTMIANDNIIRNAVTAYRLGNNNTVILRGNFNETVTNNANRINAVANYTESENSWNRKVSYSNAIPTTGSYRQGDIVWNTNPAASNSIGWVCITNGSPGAWRAFGAINA